MKEIRLSIVVPIYKVPPFVLRQCLNSLKIQDASGLEFILVDDGSPDDAGKICDEYASSDSRFIVLHEKNQGLSGARNAGFERARGEYLMFLDGDDYISSNACEEALSMTLHKKYDLVFWNIETDYSHSSKVTKLFEGSSRPLTTEECLNLQSQLLNFNGHIGQAFAKLIRRSILTQNNIKHHADLKQGAEGILFNFELFPHVDSAYYIDSPLNHYVHNEESISHSPNEKNYYLVIRCFEEIEKIISTYSDRRKLLLNNQLQVRVLYAIITTLITGYLNPNNTSSFAVRVSQINTYLSEPFVAKVIENANRTSLSFSRKVILKLIDFRCFHILRLLATVRRRQLANR